MNQVYEVWWLNRAAFWAYICQSSEEEFLEYLKTAEFPERWKIKLHDPNLPLSPP